MEKWHSNIWFWYVYTSVCKRIAANLEPSQNKWQTEVLKDTTSSDPNTKKVITCLCFISSFFNSKKAEGIPAMFSCALNSRGHSSPINSLAFFPFKNPVRLICIILESGFCKKTWQEEKQVTSKPTNQSTTHLN